ncbi:RNA-directed DNA polymerase, eukaryota, reverse transcriptase zinc-binding domain protein [Tanacetum coccineum]
MNGKLALRYVGPFEIVECVGPVAYRLKLPQELSCVHDTFHVSNLKKCLAEPDVQVPLDEIEIDENLRFVEEPIEIVERDVKKLKQRRIPLVKGPYGCILAGCYNYAVKIDDTNVSNVNKLNNNSIMKTYAKTVEKIELNKNLFSIPTSKKDNGDEVVVFDEEIVEEGSKKWVNTIYGYFVGCNMSPAELRNSEGMNTIVDQSPLMVNGKPLMVQKWSPDVCVEKGEPNKIPVWIKLFNIPLEAWSVKGISALASKLGKPLVMDDMTASMCHNGTRRSAFARVLVEIEASKGFKDIIEIQYKDKNNNVIRTKFVKVEFSWKPISCTHCNVFGHSEFRCHKSGIKKDQMENNKGTKVSHDSEGFVEVRNRRHGFYGVSKNKGKEQAKKSLAANEKGKKEMCGMENESASKSEDDLVCEENEATKNLVADEIDGVDTGRNVKFFCSFIYASNSRRERQELWAILQTHKNIANKRPWILMGDFNVTLKISEHSAKGSCMSGDMIEFNNCNPNYSIMKKLDRIMINEEFLQQFQNASRMFLPFVISDHSPAVIIIPEGLKKRRRSFRFVNNIADKEDFADCVRKEWETEINGFHMYKVVQKLKRLKKSLNRLNWKNGNLSDKVTSLKKKLTNVQTDVEKDPFNSDLKAKAASILNEYVVASNDELKLLQQKAKIQWLSEGDQNKAYFHGILKSRKHKGRIESICDENGMRFERDNVANVFVEHFKKFLRIKQDVQPLDSVEVNFDNVLSKEDAEGMIGIVTDEEIKEAIFDIDSNTASGLDGYTLGFFKKAWNIIGKEVCLAIKDFFLNGKLLGEINATMIALVPKLDVPTKVYEFRPITCCNVIYKSISKILTNRIKIGLQKVVNINQSAFILGRHIQDNILIAQELLKGYQRKKCARRCALKVDIQKAYDTAHGYFKGGRGLRQYLFTLVMELKLSNMCFADDLLVLCNEDVEFVGVIKQTMDQFSSISRLFPNIGKSTIFFGSVPLNVQNEILRVMPFQVANLPMKCLGVPLIAKKLGINDCKSLIYWASVYMLPSTTINEIEKLLKGFLWCQGLLTSGKARVAWKQVCLPKEQGELGIKSLKKWNEVLLIKQLWKIIEGKEYFNGRNVLIWFDKWDMKGPLSDIIPRRDWYRERYHDLCNIAIPTLSDGVNDKVYWLDNQNEKKEFSTKQVWTDFRENNGKVEWYHVILFSQFQPKHAFLLWLAINERLSTQDRLARWNCQANANCPLCKKEKDSHAHLFFKCEFAKQGWKKIKDKMGNVKSNNELKNIERNWRIFKQEKRTVEQIVKIITENVKMRLMSFKVKQICAVIKVAESWNLKWKDMHLIVA